MTQKLGEINGRWMMLFKFSQLMMPLLVLIMGWVWTQHRYAMAMIQNLEAFRIRTEADRFTLHDWIEAYAVIDQRFRDLPTPDVERRLSALEGQYGHIITRLDKIVEELAEQRGKVK